MFNAAYESSHELTVVYPGVRDTLKWLSKQGVEMALITNKPERFVAPLLDQMKIGRYFRWIIGGDTLPQKSPTRRRCFRDENGQYPGVAIAVCRRFAQ